MTEKSKKTGRNPWTQKNHAKNMVKELHTPAERKDLKIPDVVIPTFDYGKENLRKERLVWCRGKFSRLVLCHGSWKDRPIGIKTYNDVFDLVIHTIEVGY